MNWITTYSYKTTKLSNFWFLSEYHWRKPKNWISCKYLLAWIAGRDLPLHQSNIWQSLTLFSYMPTSVQSSHPANITKVYFYQVNIYFKNDIFWHLFTICAVVNTCLFMSRCAFAWFNSLTVSVRPVLDSLCKASTWQSL